MSGRRDLRVVIVGTPEARARLRAMAGEAFSIAGEAANTDEARGLAADAWLLAPAPPREWLNESAQVEALTKRELDVLQLLADGLSNKSIGARLGISDQTVKFHVASITGKLGVHSRVAAVRLALRRGLITL